MGCRKRHSVLKSLAVSYKATHYTEAVACYECYFKLKTINSTADKSGFWGLSLSKRGEL